MAFSLFEVQVRGELLGQEWLNIFYYLGTPGSGEVEAINACFAIDAVLAPKWAQLTTNNNLFHTISATDLFNPANVASMAMSVSQGSISLWETLQSFLTLSFQFPSTLGGTRSGGKRLAGANEGIYTDGALTPNPGFLADLLDFMLDMKTVINLLDSEGDAASLVPIVVKRLRSGTPGNYTYTLPDNFLDLEGFQIETVEFNGVSTQNTRKPPLLTTPYGA